MCFWWDEWCECTYVQLNASPSPFRRCTFPDNSTLGVWVCGKESTHFINTELLGDIRAEIFGLREKITGRKSWQGIKISIIATFPDAFADVLRRAIVRDGNEPSHRIFVGEMTPSTDSLLLTMYCSRMAGLEAPWPCWSTPSIHRSYPEKCPPQLEFGPSLVMYSTGKINSIGLRWGYSGPVHTNAV